MKATDLWHVTNGHPDASPAFPPSKQRGDLGWVVANTRDFGIAYRARELVRLAWLTGEPVTLDSDYWALLPSGAGIAFDADMSVQERKRAREQRAERHQTEATRARDDDPRWPLPSFPLRGMEVVAGVEHPEAGSAKPPGPRQEPSGEFEPFSKKGLLMLGRTGPGWTMFTVGAGPCVAWWTDQGARTALGETLVEALGEISIPGLASIRERSRAPWWLRLFARLNELEEPPWVLSRQEAALLAEAERSIACALIEASGGPLDLGLSERDRLREGLPLKSREQDS